MEEQKSFAAIGLKKNQEYAQLRQDTSGIDVTISGVVGDHDEVQDVRMSTVVDDNAFG
jgi:hypothetical protein